jgi:hypothetical protein
VKPVRDERTPRSEREVADLGGFGRAGVRRVRAARWVALGWVGAGWGGTGRSSSVSLPVVVGTVSVTGVAGGRQVEGTVVQVRPERGWRQVRIPARR